MDLYLASGSPRRKQLLEQLGFTVSKIASDIDETPLPEELAQNYTERMALQKSEQAIKLFLTEHGSLPTHPVLTADTSVAINGHILGKPNDRQHAIDMLKQLSGHTHQVISSVAVWHQGQTHQASQISEVSFRTLAEDEIEAYVASGEADDKAGSYAIQGLAAVFISHLNGSFSGVMGLPLFETANLLQACGLAGFKTRQNAS